MPIIDNSSGILESSENDNEQLKIPTSINKKLDLLDKKMDSLYSDIYLSRLDNKNNLSDIVDKLDTSIDKLQNGSSSVANMSELLRRLQSKQSGSNSSAIKDLNNEVSELFNDQNVINTVFMNEDLHKYISSQNAQYDLICKYLPRLLDALEIKRDNVLCSDNFSKKFLNPKSIKTSKQEVEIFSANERKLENKYELSEFLDDVYFDTSKYGETFVYVVPYDLAFQRLLKRANYRRLTGRVGQMNFYEQTTTGNGRTIIKTSEDTIKCVNESYIESDEYKNFINSIKTSYVIEEESTKFKGYSVNIHFNDSNVILDSINEYAVIREKSDLEKFKPLSAKYNEAYLDKLEEASAKVNSVFKNKNKNDGLSAAANVTNDGLIMPDELNRDPNKLDNNFTGAVLEKLNREDVVPLYIGNKCLGYYYFDFKEDKTRCGYCGGTHSTPGVSNSQNYAYEMSQDQQELALRFISSKISAAIDTHFINANKDLKEEIYAILKYNDKFDIGKTNDIGVSFIPAEDIIHCYFKLDKRTHRGISDLEKSVVPGMLYILLYLTDIIGKITRSTDKRIYYVKQNVETNIARTMMNVVQQIKKGNMGMRQIESMNNILNIIGKYNDFIIPLGPSGETF